MKDLKVSAIAKNNRSPNSLDKFTSVDGTGKLSYSPPLFLQERRIPFSLASPSQILMAGTLGVVNLIGAFILGRALPALFYANPLAFRIMSNVRSKS